MYSPDIFFDTRDNVQSYSLVTDNFLQPAIFLDQGSMYRRNQTYGKTSVKTKNLTLTPVSSRTSLAAQSVKLSSSLILPLGNPQHFFLPDIRARSYQEKIKKVILPEQLLTRSTFVKLELRITAPNIGMDSL